MVQILVFIGVIALFAVFIYNGLVSSRNEVANVMGAVDATLKKRFDLIPNLVATVQEYAAHEKATLTELTALRTKAMTPGLSPGEKLQVEQQLSSALRGLMVQVEGYPDLKANSNFLHLQQSLHETEEQIMAARRAYNAAVTHYNNRVQGFPGSIFAAMFGFRPENVLRTAEAEKGNVNVKNLFRT